MTDRELDDYMKTVNPDFNSHLEKGTIEMSNEYYNLLEEKMARLIAENQKLKKQLKPDYYVKGLEGTIKEYQQEMNKVAIQQKEFIYYLEDKIYGIEPKGIRINYNCEYDSEEDYVNAMQEQSRLNTLKEILQKYKEIGGINND